MENKTNNEELQSRREFFKKAAKSALPMIAIAALGPSILSSCKKDDDDDDDNKKQSSCSDCSGGCKGGCSGSCDGSCVATCQEGCDHWQN